ncbi:MAG TPA: hypothetical protein VG328_05400 [Stellaceae bacterium]|nr:hypothetical protein [Stellaceae bacterium]
MSSGWMRFALVAAVALGLSGCVAYPDPYYGYGGYPSYYGPPVAGSVYIGGGGGWHGGWGYRHWR